MNKNGMLRIPLLLCSLAALASPVGAQSQRVGHHLYCPPGIDDAAGFERCIGASTVPTDGMLFPLGPYFFVDPSGRVGLGTKSPTTKLDVKGTGGDGSTLRLLTTDSGAGGILLQRSGGTPADWALTYDSDPLKRDLVVYDNIAAAERLRIDQSGRVLVGEMHAGNATDGLQIKPNVGSVSVTYGPAGGLSGSLMTFEPQLIHLNRSTSVLGDLSMSSGSSIRFTENDFINVQQPMMYMFVDDTANFDRMVLSHSEDFENWGLRYDDDDDKFHFLGGGNAVLTVDLRSSDGRIGIEHSSPTNILTIQQGSATDPIADAWTTYSSRRWKENIAPIEDALARVKRLRGVTFDWKEDGEHDLGMIAEEVGEVVPEVVAYEENGIDAQSIDYARLTALLVEGMKEQAAQIEELTARVARLERDR